MLLSWIAPDNSNRHAFMSNMKYRLNSIVQLHEEPKKTYMIIGYITDYGEVGLNGLGNKYQFAYQKYGFDDALRKGEISIVSY